MILFKWIPWLVAGLALIGSGFLGYELRDNSADMAVLEAQLKSEREKAKRAEYREKLITSSIEEITTSMNRVITRNNTLVKEVQIINAAPTTNNCGPSVHAAVELMRDRQQPSGTGLLPDVPRAGPNPGE